MSPNETLFLESTNKIVKEDISNSSFVKVSGLLVGHVPSSYFTNSTARGSASIHIVKNNALISHSFPFGILRDNWTSLIHAVQWLLT